ncbi:hypothetical protein L1887_59357 [Cichorium endivia]|nr:hypothetical protein L1887_59357 [Cichorium endivia]
MVRICMLCSPKWRDAFDSEKRSRRKLRRGKQRAALFHSTFPPLRPPPIGRDELLFPSNKSGVIEGRPAGHGV